MTYRALYRDYRPETFEHMVGQSSISKIIKTQLISKNISHAYLFSGTRGTGKTSTAKILAMALNCLDLNDGNPCLKCENCQMGLSESFIDTIEIDAASNNKVDDIRELRDNVKYSPSKGRYKVYIIDEVHMLSSGAFNALLKTLEEPPGHVVFILATTEPQKLPATIISRCQRFDFRRIGPKDVVYRLRVIAEDVGRDISDEALLEIAKKSDGAMRDAISLMDQCFSVKEGYIELSDVLSLVGSFGEEYFDKIIDFICKGDTLKALEMIETVYMKGMDLPLFLKDLIGTVRDKVIANLKEGSDIVALATVLDILLEGEERFRYSISQQIALEAMVMRACLRVSGKVIEDIPPQRVDEESATPLNISPIKTSERIESKEPKASNASIGTEDSIAQRISDLSFQRVIEPAKEYKEEITEEPTKTKALGIEEIKAGWPEFLERLKKEKAMTYQCIKKFKPLSFDGQSLKIINETEISSAGKEILSKEGLKENLNKLLDEVYSISADLTISVTDDWEASLPEADREILRKMKEIAGDKLEIV